MRRDEERGGDERKRRGFYSRKGKEGGNGQQSGRMTKRDEPETTWVTGVE